MELVMNLLELVMELVMNLLEHLAEAVGTRKGSALIQTYSTAVSATGTLLLAVLLCHAYWTPAPMHYTAATGPGVAEAGVVSDDYAIDLASRCFEWRHTFTPETYRKRVERFRECLHPGLHKDLMAEAEQETKALKKQQMSATTTVMEATVTKRTPTRITVHLDCLRMPILGNRSLPEEALQADVILATYPPRGRAPRLVIVGYPTTPALSGVSN
jgi:hypothetical protein